METMFKPFAKGNYWWVTICFIMILWTSSSLSNTHVIPTINATLQGLISLYNEGLISHLFSSLSLFFIALPLSVVISMLISYSVLIPALSSLPNFVSKLRFLPLTGITFYLTIYIDGGRNIQTWILVIFMSTYLVTSLVAVFTSDIEDELNHAKTLGLSRWEILMQVIIIGKADYVIESIRQNFSIIWMMLVTVESLLASSGGIGFLIKNQDKFMNLGKVLALQLVILIIGLLLDLSFKYARRTLFKYSTY